MQNTILNLTQHVASPEQVSAGVWDLPEALRAELSALLTIKGLPLEHEVLQRAWEIAQFARASAVGPTVMIGGAPFLLGPLERELRKQGLKPVYAFSDRVSVDGPDGKKVSVFKHLGFVPAC